MRLPRLRTIATLLVVLAMGTGIWAGVYAYDKGFTKKWRRFMNEEFERRGIEAEIGRLTLDPFEGLVARNVKFYQDHERERILAMINHVALEIDVARLIRRENFLDSIDVKNADLWLPIDPDDKKSPRIELRDVSARVVTSDDMIEVSNVSGDFYGVRFRVRGSMLRPLPDTPEDDDGSGSSDRPPQVGDTAPGDAGPARSVLELLRERGESILEVRDLLHRFEFDPRSPPELDIEITGDLESLETAEARAELRARNVRFQRYRAESVAATAEFADGAFELKALSLADESGRLSAVASFRPGGDRVPFTLESDLDLHALASSLFDWQPLAELVFYEAPRLRLEGAVRLDAKRPADAPTWPSGAAGASQEAPRPAGADLEDEVPGDEDWPPPAVPPPWIPVELVGGFECGLVASRGAIFDGFSVDFSYEPDRYYLRNGILDHKTGTTTFQAMHTRDEGFRFKGIVGCDPRVLAPFVKRESTRRFLNRIEHRPESNLRLRVSATGPSPSIRTWRSTGRIEFQDFRFNGVPVERFATDFVTERRQHHWTDVVAERHDGTITAKAVHYDAPARRARLDGLRSTSDPRTVASCFSEKVAETLGRYRFTQPPTVDLDGLVDAAVPERTDLLASFDAGDGVFTYNLMDKALRFREARGAVKVSGQDVAIDAAGTLEPNASFLASRFPAGAPVTVAGSFRPDRRPAVDLEAKIGPVAQVTQELFGRELPLEQVSASATVRDDTVDIRAAGATLGGRAGGVARFTGLGTPESAFQGSVDLSRVDLAQLTGVYATGTDTPGALSGTFRFSGGFDDPRLITGEGTAEITDGNLYAIPIFGPLSPLISVALPRTRAGYSVAREATASFSTAAGSLRLESFEATTAAFRLVASGTVDYLSDSVNLRARMNVRGAPGLVLYPVSKLFEYRATGTMKSPGWESAALGGLTDTLTGGGGRNAEGEPQDRQGAGTGSPGRAAGSKRPGRGGR